MLMIVLRVDSMYMIKMFMIEVKYSHVGGCICIFMAMSHVDSVFVFKMFVMQTGMFMVGLASIF